MRSLSPDIDALFGDIVPGNRAASAAEQVWTLAAFYAAQGEPVAAIAERLALPAGEVDAYIRSENGAARIIQMQGRLYETPKARVAALAQTAIDAKTRILLTSGDDKLVNAVASDLLDRALGKPVQVTENRNLNINVQDLDQLNRAIGSLDDRLKQLDEQEQRLLAAKRV